MNKYDYGLTRTSVLLVFCFLVVLTTWSPTPVAAQDPTPTPDAEAPQAQCAGPDNTALDHYRRATESNRAEHDEEAAREYLLAIQCDRDYATAYRGLARAYQRQNRADEAIALFEHTLESDPQNALAHYAIGWLYLNAKDDLEKAEAEWRTALEIDPQCAIALNGMGVVYERHGDEGAALAMYRAAIAADPSLQLPRQSILGMYNIEDLTEEKANSLIASFEESLRTDPHQSFADEKRYLISVLYRDLHQYDESHQSLQRLLVEYPDSLWADYAYLSIALNYMIAGQYAQAAEPLTIAIDKYPDSAAAGEMRVMLGDIQLMLGNDAEAYRLMAEALHGYPDLNPQTAAQAEKALDRLDAGVAEVIVPLEQGLDAMSQNDYEDALAYCREAEERAAFHGDTDGRMEALQCLGTAYQILGRYVDAQNYYQESLDLALEEEDECYIGVSYGGLGNQAVRQENYDAALAYYKQAVEHFEQASQAPASPCAAREYIGQAYRSIGVIYLDLGEYGLALDWIQRGLEVGEAALDPQTLGEAEDAIVSLANLGIIHNELGELDLAFDYLTKAVELCNRKIRPGGTCVTPYRNIADLYLDMGKPDEALSELELVLETAIEDGVPYWEIGIRTDIGEVYMAQDDHESALTEFEVALGIARELEQSVSEASLLDSLGDYYRDLAQKTTALRYYRDAASTLEEYVGGLSFGETRASTLGEQRFSLYTDLVTLLIELGEEREAFEFSERARARAFLDSMAIGPIDFREGADFDLLERGRMLRTEIAALDDRLRAEISLPRGEQNAQVIENLQARLDGKRSEYGLLLNQIQATNPEYASLAMLSAVTVTETQQLLDDQTTLLEYFVTPEEKTVAFVLTHDSFNAITIPVSSDQLRDEITVFRDFASRSQLHPKSLVQLYDWLIAPVREYLHTPVLGIVPHGVLHYLPFAALTDGETYLMDGFTLFSLPSASVLPFVQRRAARAGSGLFALAQPDAEGLPHLMYAAEEAEMIAQMWDTQAIVGEDATETAVYVQASDIGVLHIAAHGEFNPFNPLFSAVVLSADEQNDGRLEVHEVYSLDLTQTNLVVLSGCETDMGHVTDGDDIIGLNRAFLLAGTPTIVGSLWRVDDESTASLMERFYVHLREGMGKAEALRKAQTDTRDRYPHPYYWAGFVLTGDYASEVTMPQETTLETTATPTPPKLIGDESDRIPWWIYVAVVVLVANALVEFAQADREYPGGCT